MNIEIQELKPFFREHLKRRGVEITSPQRHSVIRCPFHQEKTGSFTIYEDHGHCFGCGWHGDIIDLEAAITGRCRKRDFVVIIEELSTLYGIRPSESKPPILKRKTSTTHSNKAKPTTTAQSHHKAKELLDKVLAKHGNPAWRFHLINESPQILDNPAEEWRWLLQSLFAPEDLIWLGGRYDSRPENFQLLKNAVKLDRANQPLKRKHDCFALGRFKAEAQGRRTECLLSCDYILVECDQLIGKKAETPPERERNKHQNAALIQWLHTYRDMKLRAVYDTGGKSLHSIWDKPPEPTLNLLKHYCDPLGIDSQPLTSATAPLRLPQSLHETTGEPAKLLYLNPEI